MRRWALWLLTLWLIFFINPFVDAITGYIVMSDSSEVGGIGSPSQMFRLLLSGLMLVQIHNSRHLIFILLFVFYLIVLELFNFIFHTDLMGLAIGITYSYKLAFGILMYFVIDKYIQKGWLKFNRLLDYTIYSGVIYCGLVLFADLLGISYPSYSGVNLGSRGIFASANGLGIYVGVCSLLVIYKYYKSFQKKYLFFYLLMAYVLLGLMTRAAIGILLVGVTLWFINMPWKYKLMSLGVGFILIGIFIEPISKVVRSSTEMIVYRLQDADISFQGLVIGGRQELFDRATKNFTIEKGLWYRLVVGGGYFLSYRNPFNMASEYSPILEADLWDIFYMFGIVGLLVYGRLFIYGLCISKHATLSYILKIAWIMLFFHSAFAGHVIQNGMSVMVMVCLMILLKYIGSEKVQGQLCS